MNKLITYLKASKAELTKVAWPSKKLVRDHTVVVIVISIVVAVFLAFVDYILQYILTLIV